MNKRNLLLFVLTILVYSAFAAVFTYPSPNEKYQSGVYKVEVIQKGDSYNSFVYEDLNPDDHKFITDYNHWTGFSFSDKVMVKVIVQSNGRKIKSCWVHPYPKNIIPKVNKDTISFEISEAGQYFVRILFEGDKLGTPGERQGSFGYENPLFIFADPPETYIPDTNDNNTLVIPKGLTTDKIRALINSNEEKSTIYFKEGAEHRLGEKFVAKSNTTYYIPGGAYVIGNFIGDNLNNIKIIGRGIISLVNYPRHGSSKSMDWNLIYFTGDGANQYIEGITFTNPSHFCVLSRGEMHLNWCKMFGWYVQTDGFGGGDGSKVENTFMKVMDDNVKLYSSNNVIRNLVIYKQKNGAYFQHGWGPKGGMAKNCLVDEVYIVQDDAVAKERSLIEIKSNNGKKFKNFSFNSIYADQDIWNIMAFNNKAGSLKNFKISNLIVNEAPRKASHIHVIEGEVSGMEFFNFKIASKKIKKDADWKLKIEGRVGEIRYE